MIIRINHGNKREESTYLQMHQLHQSTTGDSLKAPRCLPPPAIHAFNIQQQKKTQQQFPIIHNQQFFDLSSNKHTKQHKVRLNHKKG